MGTNVNSADTYIYSSPITIDSDCVLHYALMKDNKYVSNISSQEYEIQYYTSASDYTVTLGTLKSYNGDKTNIIVPDDIKATSVYRGAFQGSNVESIVLPDKITLLGTKAFKNSALKHISATGVTKLNGSGVFYGCSDLRDEIMPSLETVTESAFEGCTKLHNIDFGSNITQFKSSLFKDSGLMYGDFPNAQISSSSNTSVFENAQLISLSIPKINELGDSFLKNNIILHELNSADIITMRSSCLRGTSFLKDFDVSKLQYLYSGALSGCWIENFYAPLITDFADSGTQFGEYCCCETVNLPNFTAALGSNAFLRSLSKNLYFENVEEFSSESVFVNSPQLDILYFPKLKNFYGAKITSANLSDKINQALGINYNQYPDPQVIWIPDAQSVNALKVRQGGFVFAMNASTIEYSIKSEEPDCVIMLSDRITDESITITALDGLTFNKLPVIVASSSSPLNTESESYNLIGVEDCCFNCCLNNMFYYTCAGNEILIPYDFIAPLWDMSTINKKADDCDYLFIYDFSNDNFINAKDFKIVKQMA